MIPDPELIRRCAERGLSEDVVRLVLEEQDWLLIEERSAYDEQQMMMEMGQ